MEVLVLVASAFLAVVAYWYWYVYKFFGKLNKFSGPTTYPFVGCALDFLNKKTILFTLLKYQGKYGFVNKLMVGPNQPVLIISDPGLIQNILNSTKLMGKPSQYVTLRKWLGSGLITSQGEQWRTHRKMITPAFHFKILEQFTDVFDAATLVMVEKLKGELGKESVDIYPYATLCALDIICETAMGTSVNAQSNPKSEYVHSVKEMCRIVVARVADPLKTNELLFSVSPDKKIQAKAIEILHSYTDSMIKQRKELKGQLPLQIRRDSMGVVVKKKLAFLDMLLEYNAKGETLMDEEQIRDEVDTFMFAGHDTTASGVSFAMYAIANHQDVQDKVVEEIKEVFGDDLTRAATYQDLMGMKYTEAVLKETLRLYPSVPLYGRQVEEDLECGGLQFAKNVSLVIFSFGLHRRADLYPEPEKFDPERFTNNKVMPPYTYLPFSAGSRNCIGQKYAMLEMKSILSRVLRNFKLFPATPEHKPKLVGEVVLKSENGLRIRLERRENL